MAEPRRERKVITVVYADLVGFTARAEKLDPEDVEAILRPYHELLRGELERFGGTVEKFIGDAVVAIFGAPVTHEDDAERAVRAALAICDAIREDGKLEVRIGVGTGEALVRLDARPEAGEGIASGDVMNTVARLQTAAPVNGILVSETTRRETKDVINYDRAEPVHAKGKAAPIEVWEAIEARSRLGVDVRQESRLPLVGRERERALLVETLARVESQRSPQLVTLIGVPGIGKSRVVFELFEVVEQRIEFVQWRQGRCLPYGDGVTFWALGDMVKAQAGIFEGDDAAVVREKLERAAANLLDEADAPWVAKRLGPLAGLETEDELGGHRRAESFAAWRRFLEAVAERRPLVLVFEDLHWADDGLLDFVDELVDWTAAVPILVLCTSRPELLERRPAWGGGKLNTLTLALSPLNDAETALLIASALGDIEISAETQGELLAHSGGNPLYAEQYARLYRERGSAGELPLPEGVHALIAARLDALDKEEKALLQDAAVIGKVFWAGALSGGGAARDRLHSLERKEFIRRERRSSVASEDEYAFRHVLVRDVAYGQIPRADRAEKHLRAARWIEALGREEDHAELLAHHYLSALEIARAANKNADELEGRALRAVQIAGERALALNAFPSAESFFSAALALTSGDVKQRTSILFGLGRAQRAREAGDEALTEATAGFVESGDYEAAAEAELELSGLERRRLRPEAALEHLARASQLVDPLPPSRAKARVLAERARHAMLDADSSEAIRVGNEALAIAEALGLEGVRAHVLSSVGSARLPLDLATGLAELRDSVAIARAINSVDIFRSINNLSAALYYSGRLEESNELDEQKLAEARRFGLEGGMRDAQSDLAAIAYERGEWDESLAAVNALIAAAAARPTWFEPALLAVRAHIRLARDDLAGALEDTARGLELSQLGKLPQALWPRLASRAWILLFAGQIEEADALLTALVRDERLSPHRSVSTNHAAWVARALGREDEFRSWAREGGPTPWLEAQEAILAGDLAAGADRYASIGHKPNAAYARLRAAESLADQGRPSEAAEQLEQALAFYRSVGATRFIREGEAVMAATA